MTNAEKVADAADVIIQGYAMTRCDDGILVQNLNNRFGAAVLTKDGGLVETNMDDIELSIARKYMLSALKYMEE